VGTSLTTSNSENGIVKQVAFVWV